MTTFENIQAEKVITLNAKLYANKADGFVGTDPKKKVTITAACVRGEEKPAILRKEE